MSSGLGRQSPKSEFRRNRGWEAATKGCYYSIEICRVFRTLPFVSVIDWTAAGVSGRTFRKGRTGPSRKRPRYPKERNAIVLLPVFVVSHVSHLTRVVVAPAHHTQCMPLSFHRPFFFSRLCCALSRCSRSCAVTPRLVPCVLCRRVGSEEARASPVTIASLSPRFVLPADRHGPPSLFSRLVFLTLSLSSRCNKVRHNARRKKTKGQVVLVEGGNGADRPLSLPYAHTSCVSAQSAAPDLVTDPTASQVCTRTPVVRLHGVGVGARRAWVRRGEARWGGW